MLALPTILCFMFKMPFEPLVISAIGLFLMIVLFGWMFSIGAWCNSKLSGSDQGNIIGYGCGLALPIVYMLMFILIYLPQVSSGSPPLRPPLWLLPMHMLSLAGIFYGVWFTARKLNSLLDQEKVNFMIFSNAFFMLFVFPLGLWVIQPAVNQLYHRLTPSEMFSHED